MSVTGYLWDEAFLGHFTSTVAPERPERADVLNATQMCADLPGLRRLKNDALLGRSWIGRVHDPDYVRLVRGAFEEGRGHLDNGETCVRFHTFDVAERAVSGALSLVREVMEGRIDNGFAALRLLDTMLAESTREASATSTTSPSRRDMRRKPTPRAAC